MGQIADELRRRRAAGVEAPASARRSPIVEELRARRPPKEAEEVISEAVVDPQPQDPTFSQLYGRPVVTGLIEAAGAVQPHYLGARTAAAVIDPLVKARMRQPSIADVMSGADDPEARERVAAELGGTLGRFIEAPLTGLRAVEDIALGPAIDEAADPSARAERYAATAGQTLGAGLGMGQKLMSLFTLSGPASVAMEEGLRRVDVDPELARKAGVATQAAMTTVDLGRGFVRFLKDKTLSPARKIAGLLSEGEMDIVSFAEQEAARRGIPLEQARREIEQAAQRASAALGADYIPTYASTQQTLREAEQVLTTGGEAQRDVAQASKILEEGNKRAIEKGFSELSQGLGEPQSVLTVGKRLKQTLKASADKMRKPISEAYKRWDARYGNRMIPVDPARLAEIEGEMKRVGAAVAAQRGQASAAGDLLTNTKMSEVLAELGELEEHLVGASVSKIRGSISALKRKLREAGLGDATGLYGRTVDMLENMLSDSLQSIGLGKAVTELEEANEAWRAYADRFYTPTVSNIIDRDGEALASVVRNSFREGNAAEVRNALGTTQVDGWTRLGLDAVKGMAPVEQTASIQQLYGKAAEAQKAAQTIEAARNSVSLSSLQQSRARVVRSMQGAQGAEREVLQGMLSKIDQDIALRAVSPRDRQSAQRLMEAALADEALLESDLAKRIRQQVDTAASVEAQADLITQAEGISPEAGRIARRRIVERYLLPKGEETTAREVAAAFRKNKAKLNRVIGETEVSESMLHELMKELEGLEKGVGKQTWLRQKAPLLAEAFESFLFTEPSQPPLR